MLQNTNVVERAYELAATGDYINADQIAAQLTREGYTRVKARAYLDGPSIQKSLREACERARAQKAKSPPTP